MCVFNVCILVQGHDGWITDIDIDEYSKQVVSCGKASDFLMYTNHNHAQLGIEASLTRGRAATSGL